MQRITFSSNIHQKQLADEKRRQVGQTMHYKANDDFLFW